MRISDWSSDVCSSDLLILEPGAVVALLGPNGGGKTSTLKICSGVLPVTRGEFRLAGQVVNGVEPSELARLGVGSIPEGRGIFAHLSVRENLWNANGRSEERRGGTEGGRRCRSG